MTEPLKVIAGTQKHPLVIGGLEIECYVLEDETRVLSRGGFQAALGRHRTSRKHQPDDVVNLPAFLAAANLKPFISKDLVTASIPIAFQAPSRGPVAYGFRAEILPAVCKVYVEAQRAGALRPSQTHIAERAEILRDGLGLLGIIGLVDEATGYQEIRARKALATILEKFIAEELQPWTKTFPFEFYQQIARLKGWPSSYALKRPSVVGHYTNDLIYSRLAPGVLEELKRKTPRFPSGTLRNKHFQWFTPEHGHPKLKELLTGVMALQRAAPNWNAFQRALQRSYPKHEEQMPLALGDDE